MIHSSAESWLTKLEVSCTRLGVDTINVLIDQAGSGLSLVASLDTFQPPLAWCSLFEGLPEEALEDEAPLLIELSLSHPMERQWLLQLMAELAPQGRILLLCSSWPFMYLARHLQQCVDARWEACAGILRFYDPRLFPVLVNQVLDAQQQSLIHSAAILWSWQDRDENVCVQFGKPASPQNCMTAGFKLDDKQIEKLATASDATQFIHHHGLAGRYELSDEQLFVNCYAALLQAAELGLIMDDECKSHVMQALSPWEKLS